MIILIISINYKIDTNNTQIEINIYFIHEAIYIRIASFKSQLLEISTGIITFYKILKTKHDYFD